MKFKALLLALVAAPIIAYVVSAYVLWFIWGAVLKSFISVSSWSDVTTLMFFGVWAAGAYFSLRKEKKTQKQTKRKTVSPLEKEITLKDLTSALKPSIKNAMLEIIVIGEGKNFHQTVNYNPEETFKFKAKNKEVHVENENLFIQRPFLKKPKLTAIFDKDFEPVKIKNTDGKVTAEILGLAKRSTALASSIKSMFNVDLPLKKILFFIIIGIVGAVVVYLLLAGGIF